MTLIKFDYSDSYAGGTRGSLAFMPHRRHAANETEVLPKPFTVPLLNGTVTVDLKPNASSWVWIVTEYLNDVSTSRYYTIPDRDGVMPANELIEIAPSSLPAAYDAIEPAWWAEMRQYKQTTGETLTKASDALGAAEEAIETGRESIEQTRNNASLAKAYSEQSRDHSYDAKEYRDEAEQWRDEAKEQADRAATGPESAAERSETAATRSETARDRAITAEDESRVHAAEARADATTAQSAASSAVTARTQAQSEADRSNTEANRAKGYADDLLAGPSVDADRAEQARDASQGYRDQAETHASNAQSSVTSAQGYATQASDSATQAQHAYQDTQQVINKFESDYNGNWKPLTITPGNQSNTNNPVVYRLEGDQLRIIGNMEVEPGHTRTNGDKIAELPDGVILTRTQRITLSTNFGGFQIQFGRLSGITISSMNTENQTSSAWFNTSITIERESI